MMRRLLPLLVAVLVVPGLAGCDEEASDGGVDKAAAVASAPPEEIAWERVNGSDGCECSNGSDFHYWVHEGAADEVAFVLEGGGACFSAATCGPTGGTSTVDLADESPEGPRTQGLLDLADPDNPLAGYSVVYVPYCTGDLHLGDRTQDYGDGVVVEHKGRVNATTALQGMAETFPDAEEVVVVGFSAGSAGAPLYGGLVHDLLPDARISVVADASGAYPGDEVITAAIGGLWGIFDDLPAWPESADQPKTAWSLPGLFVQAGRHVPGIRFATIDTAADSVQRTFTELIGFGSTPLIDLIDANAAYIEAAGVEVSAWVGPGTQHVSTATDDVLHGSEVDGTALVDWLDDFLHGDDVPDVHCVDCG